MTVGRAKRRTSAPFLHRHQPSLLLLSLDTAAARSVLYCMASESVTLEATKRPPTFPQALVVRPHLLPPTARAGLT